MQKKVTNTYRYFGSMQLPFRKSAGYLLSLITFVCLCLSFNVSAVILDNDQQDILPKPVAKKTYQKPKPTKYTETVEECIVDGTGHEYCHEISSRVVSGGGKPQGTVILDHDPSSVKSAPIQPNDATQDTPKTSQKQQNISEECIVDNLGNELCRESSP